MKFSLKNGNIEKQPTECLVIGIFEGLDLTPTAKILDKLTRGQLSTLLKKDGFSGKLTEATLLNTLAPLACQRLYVVGCGKKSELNIRHFRNIVTQSIKAISKLPIKEATLALTELPIEKRDTAEKVKHMAEASADALYIFDTYKSKKEPAPTLHTLTIDVPENRKLAAAQKTLHQAICIHKGITFTKNLANTPSNICTPTYLAAQAKKLGETHRAIKVKILSESDMKKLGMGAFLAVAKGSAQEGKLICLEYKGSRKKKSPIALVGKGITFDTGGISLKPAEGMIGMKYDMCGAATVLGTFKAVAELKLPINLVGILAAAENMPSGTGDKPEDIVTTLSGQTVEILNTDAEGRLVLCDALTYCERYKPETVIDIATLTGAVVIALGHHATGLLSNHEPLAKELIAAGQESFDRVWQMPLWEEYQDQLKSPFADMANVGGRAAGTITAACFLSRFTKKFHWAHLDVAGTAAMMMHSSDRGATGRPVPLLMQYLINKCKRTRGD